MSVKSERLIVEEIVSEDAIDTTDAVPQLALRKIEKSVARQRRLVLSLRPRHKKKSHNARTALYLSPDCITRPTSKKFGSSSKRTTVARFETSGSFVTSARIKTKGKCINSIREKHFKNHRTSNLTCS